MPAKAKRHIIFFGETGTGKSSAINLLLSPGGTPAQVSNDAQPCTRVHNRYEATLNGNIYNLWDTRGLGGGVIFFRTFFGGRSAKELRKFLKERHERHEIDLLVFCIRGSRATKASLNYYKEFCIITRQLAAPVVLVITHLDRERDMGDWWERNSASLRQYHMEFDDHACVTTLPNHLRTPESKERLVDVITKEYEWEVERDGSYFGTRVRKSPPAAPVRSGISSIFKPREDSRDLTRRHNSAGPSSPSTMGVSSFHTADGGPVPLTPVTEPPTQFSASATPKLPPINTNPLRGGCPSPSSNEEPSSTGSSVLDPSPLSSLTSHSESSSHSCHTVDSELKACTNATECNESSKYLGAKVRRKGPYAVRRGAFGDIWQCNLVFGETSFMVAVKAVNTGCNGKRNLCSDEKVLRRELKVWGQLHHSNIVPLLGVVSGFGPLPSMVSPWFHNGSLSSYLARHRKSPIEKHRLLGDIAAGLHFLHSQGVVHGDLHSDNVLINDHGRACLTDFGLSLINEFVGTSYLKSSVHGSIQFTDPALVQRVNGTEGNVFYPNRSCDVYSFGGLILHALSGKKPYHGMTFGNIFITVMKGDRPQIPSDDVPSIPHWHESLMKRCWDQEELRRPSARELVKLFDREP